MEKPGYKTTEFWMTLVSDLLNAAVASGAVPSKGPWRQIVSTASVALAALGYSGFRANVKADSIKAAALVSTSPKNPT